MRFNIGMTGTTKPVDVREVKIRNYKEITFLPPEKYYACEKLPKEWIKLLVT